MFFANVLPLDIPIMEIFIKAKAREIVNVLCKDSNGFILKAEVPYVVRYFHQFPSQQQVVNEIIPEMEKLESGANLIKDILEIEAFEKHLVTIMKTNLYSGYEKETLLEAFRVLDSGKDGYIDLHTFYAFVKSYGVSFTKEEIAEMETFLKDNETEFLESLGINQTDFTKKEHKKTTTRKFYYEAYVRKCVLDNKKQFDLLMAEYQTFLDDYKSK
jgi:Ca2+-binding EF-hand superfamily protein